MSKRHVRKRHFVDSKVQGTLLIRIARYWLLSVAAVGMFTVLGWIFVSPGIEGMVSLRERLPALFGGLIVAVVAALFILPFILLDLARFTNRFAGPMFRLHRAMERAADGQSVEPIRFRDGDFWKEYADTFNRLLVRLEKLERRSQLTDRQTNGCSTQDETVDAPAMAT